MHRIIKFNQRSCLKICIDVNARYRKEAKTEFEKNFFKLLNNSVYGKTMENIRNHRDIKLIKSGKKKKTISFRTQISLA